MIKAAKNVFKADHECPIIPLEPRKDQGNEIAIVACGDFTAPRQRFQKMEGVERVVLGYTGGKKEKPTFTKIHDHTEALLVEFNPQKVSYRRILEVWHECDKYAWEKEKQQYRSALFWKSLSQQDTALQFIQELQANNPTKKLHSEVERARRFYRAKQTCPELPLEPKQVLNEIAVVACGSFVGAQHRFGEMEGVERVITAYTGGKKESPKHHKPYDHSEALFIEFNPTLISYSQILEVWHECDNPWEEQIQQYRSAVFWKALSQQDTTLQFIEELKANNPKKKLYTDVEPVRKVYEAEVYESEGSDVGESPRNGKKALAQPSPRNRKKSAALQSGQKL